MYLENELETMSKETEKGEDSINNLKINTTLIYLFQLWQRIIFTYPLILPLVSGCVEYKLENIKQLNIFDIS